MPGPDGGGGGKNTGPGAARVCLALFRFRPTTTRRASCFCVSSFNLTSHQSLCDQQIQ